MILTECSAIDIVSVMNFKEMFLLLDFLSFLFATLSIELVSYCASSLALRYTPAHSWLLYSLPPESLCLCADLDPLYKACFDLSFKASIIRKEDFFHSMASPDPEILAKPKPRESASQMILQVIGKKLIFLSGAASAL